MKRLLVTSACLATLLPLIPSHAETIRVPADQPTIQAGIDAASAGDVVLVAPGSYSGPGNFGIDFGGTGLTLTSEAGAASTIIHCQYAGRAFYFHTSEDTSAVVQGFTITGGMADRGGGMWCNGSSPKITDCVFHGNTATGQGLYLGGGAVYCSDGSDPVFRRVEFRNNQAARGGGLACIGWSDPVLRDAVFEENVAEAGGGLYAREVSAPRLADAEFIACTALTGGGAYFDNAAPVLTRCLFDGNDATGTANTNGGGGLHAYKTDPVESELVFASNTAVRGGAVYFRQITSPDLSGCTLSGNSADYGGGIYSSDSSPLIENTIIAFAEGGEAVYCADDGTPSIFHCCVFGNAGGDSLCGDYHDNIFEDPLFCDLEGGDFRLNIVSPCLPANNPWGILIGALEGGCESTDVLVLPDGTGDYPTLQAAIDSCATGATVIAGPGTYTGPGNTDLDFRGKLVRLVSQGGSSVTEIDCQGTGRGLRFCSGEMRGTLVRGFTIANAYADTGAGVLCDGSSPTIEDCVVTGCIAVSGAGIACVRGASPKISGSLVEGNQAGFGGGLHCSTGGSPAVDGSTFASNFAAAQGGGIWVGASEPELTDVTVRENSSNAVGGGVCCVAGGDVVVRRCTVVSNTAEDEGGGLYCSGSDPWVESVTFFDNGAGGAGGCISCVDSSPYIWGVIISFSESGAGLHCEGAPVPLVQYTDIYGNAGGDSLSGIDLGGNLSTDPLMCDVWADDFTLCANSPCIVASAPQGWMGRYGVGCSSCGATGVSAPEDDWVAAEFEGLRCAPNPSRGPVTLEFCLPDTRGRATLSVFSVSGRLVARVLENVPCRGLQTVSWDGTGLSGDRVASGVYLVRLEAGSEILTQKVLLLR